MLSVVVMVVVGVAAGVMVCCTVMMVVVGVAVGVMVCYTVVVMMVVGASAETKFYFSDRCCRETWLSGGCCRGTWLPGRCCRGILVLLSCSTSGVCGADSSCAPASWFIKRSWRLSHTG